MTAVLALTLGGCSSLGSAGPTTGSVKKAPAQPLAVASIQIVPVDDIVARRVLASGRSALFSEALGDAPPIGTLVGPGDVLDISIWEAPPATLFGTAIGDTGSGLNQAATSISRATALPEQMVDDAGRITIPFVGAISVAGLGTREIEQRIAARLAGKAHLPQAIVRLVRNTTADATVVGDVTASTRLPLTPKGERLLDALAAAGGVRQPVGKTVIQITRGSKVAMLPLATVIRDPAQNIRLRPNDVVTALFQPYSFTSMGAVEKTSEIDFEATGITLAQALGRVGGLRDDRANVRGVFIFRLEDPSALDPAMAASARMTPDGRIPVIYRIDMANAASFFVAQSFPIRDKDVLYVSNAPLVDIQKFVNMVSSLAVTGLSISNVTN